MIHGSKLRRDEFLRRDHWQLLELSSVEEPSFPLIAFAIGGERIACARRAKNCEASPEQGGVVGFEADGSASV